MPDNKKDPKWIIMTNEYVRAIKHNAYYEYFWALVYASGIFYLLFLSNNKKATLILLGGACAINKILSTFIAARNAYLVLDAFSEKKDNKQE